MAGNLKEIKDKKTATNQVLDYFKCYSQNQELSKFFSGITSVTNIQENVCELKTNQNINVSTIHDPKENCLEQSLDISPTSSTMSNRKLEWDNGADIGYSNCQDVKILQRSFSLPVFPSSDINKFDACQKISNINSSKSYGSAGGDNVNLVIFTCSSSSETKSPLTDYSSSSFLGENSLPEVSPSNSSNKISISQSSDSSTFKKISNFSTTLSYLKQKIGFPGAHSTPYLPGQLQTKPILLNTPVEQHSEMSLQISAKKEYACNSNEHLPEGVSSLNQKDVKKNSNAKTKIVTLCLTKPFIVECEPILNQMDYKVDKKKQTTIGIQTEDISEKEKELISVTTKTCSNLNQSVFHYEHTDTDVSNIRSVESSSGLLSSNCDSFQCTINYDTVTNDKSEGLYEIIKDCDKLDQTLHNSCHSEKVTDSTNFHTQCFKNRFLAENETLVEDKSTMIPGGYKLPTNNSQVSSDLCIDIPSITTNNIGNQLEKNIRLLQKLVKSKKYDLPTKKRYIKKIIKHISDSKLLEVSSIDSELLFSGDSKLSTEHMINDYRLSFNHELYSPRVNKTLSSAKLYQSWKKDKTLSEKMFEEKHYSGDGQYMVNWAEKEREYQIFWISNEINHLGQLKNLLENKVTVDSNPKESRKPTSVYEVSHKSCESSEDNSKKCVTQSELDVETSERLEYNLNSKKFGVGNLFSDVNNWRKSRQISDDIKKMSSDNVNFNVSTFCKVCKRSPCICRTEGLNNSEFIQKYISTTEDRKSVLLKTGCPDCQKLVCDTNCITKQRNQYAAKSKIQGSEFLPITKLECTGLSSSLGHTKTPKIEKSCSTCGKSFCSCEQYIENKCFCQNVKDLQKASTDVQSRPRNKIFENCICSKEDSCDCQFVDKLLNHFDIHKIDTNEYARAKNLAYKCIYDHVAVQTETDKQNKDVQTSNYQENKLSQTDEKMIHYNCEHSGQQTQDVLKNNNSQTKSIKNKFTQTIRTLKHNSVCTNADKRSEFMKSDYNFEKRNRSTYGCISANKISSNMSKSSMKYTSLQPRSKTNLKMSTVGTCICGFSDKVYGRQEFHQRWSLCDNMEDVTANEISVSTNSAGSTKNICVSCQKEHAQENIVILTYRKQEWPYCLECLKSNPILTSIYNADLKRMQPFLSESKSQSVRVANEMAEQYVLGKHCSCTKPTCMNNYCAYCLFKLGNTIKNNNGIAYSLTLKCVSPLKYKYKKKKTKQLEEIILKVPCPYSNKKHKDQDNLTKQDVKESRMYQKNRNVQTEKAENDMHKQKNKIGLTLQEYLKINRPDFINSAECRRKAIEKYKIDREQIKDQNKLRWLDNGISILHHNPTRRHALFTEKEMKEITERNYIKLPEIINNQYHYRQRRLRNADKYIVDTFTKKIQGSVLKGKRSFPIGMNIVSMQI